MKNLSMIATFMSLSIFVSFVKALERSVGSYARIKCPVQKVCNIKHKISQTTGIDFIFISDSHPDLSIKSAMSYSGFQKEILSLGVKIYGIEAPRSDAMISFFSSYNEGHIQNILSSPDPVGPGMTESEIISFAQTAEAYFNLGLAISPIDHPNNSYSVLMQDPSKHPCPFSREWTITNNLIETRYSGPVITLIGGRHAAFAPMSFGSYEPVNSTAEILVDLGYNVITIVFEGTDADDDFYPPFELPEGAFYFCSED